MFFDLKKSKIYKAVVFLKIFPPKILKFWRSLLLFLGLGLLIIYLITKFIGNENEIFLGIAYIFLPAGFSILFFEIYFESYLKHPKNLNEENIAEFLDFDSANVFDKTISTSKFFKEKTISTDSLLATLCKYNQAQDIFLRLGVNYNELLNHIEKKLKINREGVFSFDNKQPNFSEELINLLVDANNNRIEHKVEKITIIDLFISLFEFNQIFNKLMIDSGLDKNDLKKLTIWYESRNLFLENRKKFWSLENLLRQKPIGVGWIYGYSPFLNRFSFDITRMFEEKKLEIKLIGRQNVISQIEKILSRAKENNILLVGEPGVGKKTVIMGLAQMIFQGKALPDLNYKRVFELNIPLIASSFKEQGEIQNTLIAVLNEAVKSGNIILIINDLHNFIGSESGLGKIDISTILIPYLESSGIQIIATTDPVSFHKYIEAKPEIAGTFEKIDVEEPPKEEVIEILEDLVPSIEAKSRILITYQAIKKLIDDSDMFITKMPFPEKAIDLLNEVVSYAKFKNKSIILPQDVDEVITQKTKIPLGEITAEEKERLLNLEAEMHKEIVNQDEAVRAVVQTMQRLRAGLIKKDRPAGAFLFLGPTGVGKTLTAKILAKTYFGSPEKMIRFDMSEYQNPESVDRFLGSLKLNEPGQLTSLVRDNPFSVLLLDEFEKANKNILNLFLQVFDEGRVTDVFGRKVSFKENIIIATSNAGAELIINMVEKGINPTERKQEIIRFLIENHIYAPELLNRFDEIIIFHPLNQEQIRKVAEILIGKLIEKLKREGYFLKINPEVIDYIAKIGFDPKFGARPMERVIQEKIENLIAKKIIDEVIKKGVEFTISIE